MAGSTPPSENPSRRQAAIFVGGQRRRLTRRSGTSRLHAASTQDPEATSSDSLLRANHLQAGLVTDPQELPNAAHNQQEVSKKAQENPPKPYCVSKDSIATGFQPTTKPCLSGATDASLMSAASKTVTEDKKSYGLFDSLKSKDRDRTITSQPSALSTSPLPPLTPSKAVQVLGLPTNTPTLSSPRRSNDDGDDLNVSAPVRRILKKQLSVPVLTKLKEVTARYKFKEKSIEADPWKQKALVAENGNKKATKKLGFLPFLTLPSKSTPNLELATSTTLAHSSLQGTDDGHRNGSDLPERPHMPPTVAQPVLESPTRRRRKRQPKALDRMSPITETSHDELRTAYRDNEHAPELDVISEYEQENSPFDAPTYPLSRHAFNMAANVKYELADDDLSSEEGTAGVEPVGTYQSTPIDLRQKKWPGPATVRKRGPLQTVEDRVHNLAIKDLTIKNLEEEKRKLKSLDDSRAELDAEVAVLKASHEKMKKEFEEMKKRHAMEDELWRHHKCNVNAEKGDSEIDEGDGDEEDDEDLISLRSSINLDEEPTVHEARAVTFIKVVPGMVKLVDIPPRKKKPSPVDPVACDEASPAAFKPRGNESSHADVSELKPYEAQSTPFFKHGQKPKTFVGRSENLQPNIHRPEPEDFARHTIARKAKMPRNESRLLVEDWITKSPVPSEQRPVSERIDFDVLADQQIPPAPFPKEYRKG